ncbi:MAG: two-component sensor histidine kinase [Candidatus Pelagibacter sp. TMED275]|nr:MAG: two-component sensor histidine kinase [Candidatus Pelagibacter sp. TMED275]|tara:strand:- start:756 stop:2294 length:1539 start_codon:yes stop_codon:yes gene_type:complete
MSKVKTKNSSILKKFLLINFILMVIIGILTYLYINSVQPNLIKKKTIKHTQIIENTVDHIKRLNIEFETNDIKNFLLSTRFLFQNLDRVIFFNNELLLIGDTDTYDLDPKAFSKSFNIIEETNILEEVNDESFSSGLFKNKFNESINKNLLEYRNSKNLDKPFTFVEETYSQFLLITIKNVKIDDRNIGFLAVAENANEIRAAINERKNFTTRTSIIVVLVIAVFSIILNKYFLKPIKNLVDYTKIIKEKSKRKSNIEILKQRRDELGTLSKSLDDMTIDLHKRINIAENFSTDLVHEIRNPLASLKSAAEIIRDTEDRTQREKLVNILSHDVERIERLITDYSQMLRDEVALSTEKMKKIDLKPIIESVVDDYNGIYVSKRGISISLQIKNKDEKFIILGIENRIEQILANLLDNAISFSLDNSSIEVRLELKKSNQIILKVIDEGRGFKEQKLERIFDRFYSNRPDSFGEHSGLGLNIVKNLVDLHGGSVNASNNHKNKGAKIEISFTQA